MTPTTDSDLSDQILKSDKLGRVRVPIERRYAILDEFGRCGMSDAAFAAHCGINYQTLAAWRQKRRRRSEGSAANTGAADTGGGRLPSRRAVRGGRFGLPSGRRA